MAKEEIKVDLKVDSKEFDELINKANELNNLLEKAKTLVDELASSEINIQFNSNYHQE